jgi:hypothetical protein
MRKQASDAEAVCNSPLNYVYDRFAVVELLVKRRADIDARDDQGRSPGHNVALDDLTTAIQENNINRVGSLCGTNLSLVTHKWRQGGINMPHYATFSRQSPLHLACLLHCRHQ